tara:strand:+ start:5157 stop:7628 length:2472 start_codon:yes stop_codon:yes gene_type:complete
MAGYTRQSTAGIVDGGVISASDLNNEFNQVQTAMGTSGHDHSGTAGNGPKITATGLADNAVTTAKINADAVTNAKIADDSIDSEHYVDGSIDTAHLADNAVTAAKLDETGSYTVAGLTVSSASIVLEGATADAHETTITVADPTADRTVTIQDATDTLVGRATTDTLTNKSVSLASNTVTGSLAQFNTALSDDNFVSLTGSETLTNKTLTSPTITSPTASGLSLSDSSVVFEGATANDFETTLTVTDPTADRTVTIKDASGTVALTSDITLGTLSVTATASELNIVDGDTSATGTTLADADRVVVNDAGTMVQVALTDFETYFESALDTLSNVTTVGALNAGSITSGFGNVDVGSSNLTATGTVSLGATSFNDNAITNVGDIALDSISADGTDINVAVSDNSATAFTIKQGSDNYLVIDTGDSSESISIGTGVSGTAISIGHGTSQTTVNDNLTVTGNLTVNGDTTTVSTSNTTVEDNLLELNSGASSNANDSGIIIERGSTGDNAVMLWDESADKFAFGTTTATADSTGNISYTAAGLTLGSVDVDNINVNGNAITSTDTNGNITITPNGTGEVDISKVDIDSGAIDGTTIGANSAAAGTFSQVTLASGASVTSILDEDNFASDSATALATQQSIKAYIASQTSASTPAGVIVPYAGTSAPTGYQFCNGQALDRSTFSDLFSAIGTTYGAGNGSSTFNVPDLRGRVIAGLDTMGSTTSQDRLTNFSGGVDGDTLGATGGSEKHRLQETESGLVSHTHADSFSINQGNGSNEGSGLSGFRVVPDQGSLSNPIGGAVTAVTGAQAATAHNNVQPTIILNYIIKT